jgi:hypothetical protein
VLSSDRDSSLSDSIKDFGMDSIKCQSASYLALKVSVLLDIRVI